MFANQSGWPKTCPTGYSQQLVAVEQDCEIHVCVKSTVLSGKLPTIRRPPYIRVPETYSGPLYLTNQHTGHTWFKRSNSTSWELKPKK